MEFAVRRFGRHGKKEEKKPSYITKPTDEDLAAQKRKMNDAEGESKRRRRAEEDKEVYFRK